MITNHDLKHEATELSKALQPASSLTPELRARVVALRVLLLERGINDPILGRLDTATVAPASVGEIAQQLAKIAGALD